MRKLTVPALALIGSLGLVSDARAGCCDDFWSCLAAAATAGVSCQIQGIIDTINALKQAVDTLGNDLRNNSGEAIRQAQQAVTQALDDMKRAREESLAKAQKAAQVAHELATKRDAVIARAPGVAIGVGPALPAGAAPVAAPIAAQVAAGGVATRMAAPPKPADAAAIKDAFTRADAYVADLQAKADAHQKDVAAAERSAVDALPRHVAAAQRIAMDIALTPLRMLGESLLDLLSHPERLFDPSAQIEADIQRITTEIPAMLTRMANEVTQEAMSFVDRVKPAMNDLQDTAESSKTVADAMQKVNDSRTQADLDALERLLPRQPRDRAAAVRLTVLPGGIAVRREIMVAVMARTDAAKLPIVIKHSATVNDIASRWQGIKTRIKAPAAIDNASVQRVDREIGQMFAGKGKPDADKKRRELLDEANKRFANDPKTLQKVRQYLETHSPS